MKPFFCPTCKGYMVMDDETIAGPPGEYYSCVECGNHFEVAKESNMHTHDFQPTDTQGHECECGCGAFWRLEPYTCENCNIGTQVILIIESHDENGKRIRLVLCEECFQGYCESLEPGDAHYHTS